MPPTNPPTPLPPQAELDLLVAPVTHYLINIYSGFVSYFEMLALQGDTGQADLDQWRESLVDSARLACSIARKLASHAAAMNPAQPEPVDLHALIHDEIDSMRAAFDPLITWVEPAVQPAIIKGDPTQLRALVRAALLNAAEASAASTLPSKSVAFQLEVQPDKCVVRVENSSDPVDPATAQRVFEPFFTTKDNHAGIGLTIARAIARRHFGTMQFQAASTGGATLVITLPANLAD